MAQKIAIGFESDDDGERANCLANQYDFVLDRHSLPRLEVSRGKLVLLSEGFSPLSVDFNAHVLQKRREEGKKQGLVQACKPTKGLRILDATAGWGRDAAVLARFGADVVMLERQPMMAALLQDGLERLSNHPSLSLSLVHTDTNSYLQTLAPEQYPDVIYIDPMHPVRQKSALVKKDMQVLQRMLGADEDVLEWVTLAMTCAQKKVVIKWPQRLPCLSVPLKPSFCVAGKTVRFDVWMSSCMKKLE
jgi:16S rRNA (guanine1516-N2)-methyltransferase